MKIQIVNESEAINKNYANDKIFEITAKRNNMLFFTGQFICPMTTLTDNDLNVGDKIKQVGYHGFFDVAQYMVVS
jgi:hypothetical protein